MDILNTNTNEVKKLSLIDPKTSCDMLADYAPIKEDKSITYNAATAQYEASSDTIEWWDNCLTEYQQLEDKLHAIKTKGSDADRSILDSILADALDYEFNDRAGYILSDINNKISDLKIKITPFDYNWHSAKKHESSTMPAYVRHNMDVYNEINGLGAVYQSGLSRYNDDYSLPAKEFELSIHAGTDNALVVINGFTTEDIDGFTESDMVQVIEDINEDFIKTKADIYVIHAALMQNNIDAQKYACGIEKMKGDEDAE